MINSKKGSSDLQKLAQKENYALFQIQGMLGHIATIRDCGSVSEAKYSKLLQAIVACKNDIKDTQELRMRNAFNARRKQSETIPDDRHH